jgi:hypothetical protein
MIEDALTQTVQHRARTGQDVTGTTTHGPERTLRARIERRNTWVLTPEGRIRDEITQVFVEERINTGDDMDTGDGQGWRPVDAVEDLLTLEGEFEGTKCLL